MWGAAPLLTLCHASSSSLSLAWSVCGFHILVWSHVGYVFVALIHSLKTVMLPNVSGDPVMNAAPGSTPLALLRPWTSSTPVVSFIETSSQKVLFWMSLDMPNWYYKLILHFIPCYVMEMYRWLYIYWFLSSADWLQMCKEGWGGQENLDVLWHTGLHGPWNHLKQRSRCFSRSLVAGNFCVWTSLWRVSFTLLFTHFVHFFPFKWRYDGCFFPPPASRSVGLLTWCFSLQPSVASIRSASQKPSAKVLPVS